MFPEHFSPKVVAEFNDYKVEVVKAEGEFVWHAHQILLIEPTGTPNTGDAGGAHTAIEERI